MTDQVRVEKAGGILTLVLARTEKKNALTDAMYKVLADELENAEGDAGVRVIVLRADGDTFTAGNDLSEFAAANSGGGGPRNVGRFIKAISVTPKPVIAAVQGRAVGVGTTLLLHCDHVILAQGALLTTPFVNLALVPEAGSSLLLTTRIGHARAFSMFALGEAVTAEEALSWGLANRIVAPDELANATLSVARRLARQPLGALMATKRLMRDAEATARQIDLESAEFRARLRQPEAREAFAAFAERRPPDFTRFG